MGKKATANPIVNTYGELMATDEKPSGYPVKALSRAVKEVQKKKPVTNDDDADSGDDPQNGAKLGKEVQTVDPRKYVVINPPMVGDRNQPVTESRSQTQIDYLIRLGLGDQDRLNFYRQVMTNPKKANEVPYLRKYVSETLDLVLNMIFEDPQMYNRVRTKLQDNLPKGGIRAGMKKIEDALVVKSHRSGIAIDVLIEVYNRGIEQDGDQEKAFNRVNSYIAGGRARKLDADLDPVGVGTDELTKRYADMTPGQSFELIKKALKGNRNDV